MRTPEQTAILLAALLNRTGRQRARISTVTIKLLSGRQSLRSSFVVKVIDVVREYNWILFELSTSGFGAVHAKALEAAKAATVKTWLNEMERAALRTGNIDYDGFAREAMPDLITPEDDD